MRRITIPAALLAAALLALGSASDDRPVRRPFLTPEKPLPIDGRRYDRVEVSLVTVGCFHHSEIRATIRRHDGRLELDATDATDRRVQRTLTRDDTVALNAVINHFRAHDRMGASTTTSTLEVRWFAGAAPVATESLTNDYGHVSRYAAPTLEGLLESFRREKRSG